MVELDIAVFTLGQAIHISLLDVSIKMLDPTP
jgi:hypothetical protein